MNINRVSKIGLLRDFKAYCESRGNDLITHTNRAGASWDVCAVGSFLKASGYTVISADHFWADHIEPALFAYNGSRIGNKLCHADLAERYYPTYADLAADLGKLKCF